MGSLEAPAESPLRMPGSGEVEASRPFTQAFTQWLKFETCGDKELEKAVQAAWEWYLAFTQHRPARWLSYLGRSGTGKTYLAKRLFRFASTHTDWSRCAYLPRYIYWPEFVQQLRDPESNAKGMRNDMGNWPVLLLDDCGAERDTTGFAQEELNTLLGRRVGKWTLFTSNLTPEGIAKVDERIRERLVRDDNIAVVVNTVAYSTRQMARG